VSFLTHRRFSGVFSGVFLARVRAADRQGRQARSAPPVVRRWAGLRIPPRV